MARTAPPHLLIHLSGGQLSSSSSPREAPVINSKIKPVRRMRVESWDWSPTHKKYFNLQCYEDGE